MQTKYKNKMQLSSKKKKVAKCRSCKSPKLKESTRANVPIVTCTACGAQWKKE